MDNLGGMFVFLSGGLALALLIAVLEFFVNAVVSSKSDRVSVYLLVLRLGFGDVVKCVYSFDHCY